MEVIIPVKCKMSHSHPISSMDRGSIVEAFSREFWIVGTLTGENLINMTRVNDGFPGKWIKNETSFVPRHDLVLTTRDNCKEGVEK